MLSVQPLKSAQGAADYYAAAFNYYAGDAQAMRWLGKGAEYLGLSGVVEKEQMLQLLEGKLSNGQRLQNKKGEHRPGFDMTFSAPKSVSILIGLQADPRLEQLHDLAVERAISYIEKEFAQARVVIDGKVHYVDTGKLVVAAFRQPSSRANDPATHTHGVTMNITITDEDGKARSLASDIHGYQGVIEQLQKYITFGGLVYRTELGNLLKENDYRLDYVGKGMFELEGFSKEVLREFSTRRVEIEETMHENEWEGSRLASKATLLTRPSKEEHNIDVLRADWKKRADRLGFDPHEFVKNHKAQTKELQAPGLFNSLKERIFNLFFEKEDLIALASKEALFVAIETITQQTSVFDERTLKELALRHTLTGNTIVPIDAIEKRIDAAIKSQDLYEAQDSISNKRHFTTPWALTLETETLARIEHNKGIVRPISTVHAVTKKQEMYESQSSFSLTNSQKNALMHVFLSEDRFNAIQGYAGAGKTTLLQLTTELATEKGFTLRGVAVTSSAVNELRSKAQIHSDVFPIVHQELQKAKNGSLDKTIYVLDEASMLSTIQGHELIKLIEQKGARLLLVGDADQLSSVKCGRIFGQAQDYGIQTTRMTDIIRQNTPMAKQSVHDAITRNLHDSLQKLNQVRELSTHDERIEYVANQWLNMSPTVRASTLVFAPTHRNRQEITQIIREELKKEGVLSGQELLLTTLKAKPMEEIQYHHLQYYQKGDVLRFNLRIPRSNIKAGDYLTVDTITEKHKINKTVPLINKENKTVLLHLSDFPKYEPTRAGLNRPLEFYEKCELALCINDKVLITRNNRKAGMENSSLAQVKSIGEHSILFHFEKDDTEREIDLCSDELKHLDHGYVLTNMKVQGKDKTYGIGLMESYNKFSATLRNYYVQISRAITSMTLITDDKTRLLKALEFNDDEKKTALNAVESDTVLKHQQRFETHKQSIPITPIMGKKLEHEQYVTNQKELIHQFSSAKEQQKPTLAAKLALEITSDKKTLRLARQQLGYSESTIRQDALKMETLKLYKTLSDSEQKKLLLVKSYIKACDQTFKAYKSVHNGNKSPLQQSVAFEHKLRRNELAHQIYESIEEYKPYLCHFSVGTLNRLGLPQYQIQKGEERALKRLTNLGEHAKQHQVLLAINTFFTTTNSAKKEHIGYLLKNQSKTVHPFLIKQSNETANSVSSLWKSINYAASEYADREFRKTLNDKGKNYFDSIKNYKKLSREVAVHFSSSLYYIESGKEIPKEHLQKQNEFSMLRSEIAFNIQNTTDTDKILNYFKIDKQSLSNNASRHTKRQAVCELANKSNFVRKKEAAQLIAQDLKGHYPFIKELGIDTKKLNALIRIDNRKAFVDELNDTQKKEYLCVVEYKITRKKASIAWKKIFSDKEKNEVSSDWNIRQAQELTAKRDFLASYICKSTNTHAYLEKENLDLIKIEAHGKQHGARVKTIQEMAQKKGQLLNQLENRISKMNRIEAKTWHKSWDNLTVQFHRIFNNNPLYGKAIESSKLSLVSYTEKQREFLDKHELLNKFIAQKPLKHAYLSQQLSVIKKEYFDANAVNESLTSNPIEAYRAIFGEPKKITSREMRYPGGLIISLKGSKSGCWYDFSMGEGGNPIQAIMRERNISFPEALKEGAAISGITKSISIPIGKENKNHMVNEKEEDKNKILSARSIVKGAIPIKNTLAERYLKLHRSIENPERLNVLFWPKGSAWKGVDENGNLYERVNKIPALLIPAYNEKNELTGVQRIYLDSKSGKKNTFLETAKLSQGKLENSAGILQKGDKFGRLYLTEGPETGASIAMADPKSTVLVSLGLSNLKNLNLLIKRFNPKEVIIAGDNDTLSKNKTLNITFEAQQYYKNRGIESRIILPNSLSGMEKTDWNDVHKICGLSALKEQLGLDRNRSELTDYSKVYHGIIDKKIDSFVSGYNEKTLQNKRELSNIMPDISDTKSIVGSSLLKENAEINIKEIKNNELSRKQITLDL